MMMIRSELRRIVDIVADISHKSVIQDVLGSEIIFT